MTNIVPVKQYAVMQAEESIRELFELNFGDDGLYLSDLPRVKFPTTGSTVFDIPDGDPVKYIEGVIVHAQPRRVYFEQSFQEDPTAKPVCYSRDGKTGEGKFEGRNCKTCPFAQFGKNGERPKCTQRMELYILQKDALLPLILNLPPTSLENWRKYKVFCFSRGFGAFQYVVTQIGLKTEQTKTGRQATRAIFKPIYKLGAEERKKVNEYIEGIKPLVQQAAPQEAEQGVEEAAPLAKASGSDVIDAEPIDLDVTPPWE